MKTCPACKSSIDVEATKCPRCQTLFDAEAMRAGRREQSSLTMRKLIAFALVVTALVAWAAWPGNVERLANWTVAADSLSR